MMPTAPKSVPANAPLPLAISDSPRTMFASFLRVAPMMRSVANSRLRSFVETENAMDTEAITMSKKNPAIIQTAILKVFAVAITLSNIFLTNAEPPVMVILL